MTLGSMCIAALISLFIAISLPSTEATLQAINTSADAYAAHVKRALRVPNGPSFVHDEYDRAFCEKWEVNGHYPDNAVCNARVLANRRYDGGIGHLTGCTSLIIASQAGNLISHDFPKLSIASTAYLLFRRLSNPFFRNSRISRQ